jgi:hypothetical protein
MPQKRDPRTIVVKMLLNADEFVDFDGACTAEDVSHSRAARTLVKDWVTQRRNGTQAGRQREWPSVGQNLAMFLPSRQQYGGAAMRMRL